MNKKLLSTILVAIIVSAVGVASYYIGAETWYDYQQQQAWRRNFKRKYNDDHQQERSYTELSDNDFSE